MGESRTSKIAETAMSKMRLQAVENRCDISHATGEKIRQELPLRITQKGAKAIHPNFQYF
jgi:hypothetical protein